MKVVKMRNAVVESAQAVIHWILFIRNLKHDEHETIGPIKINHHKGQGDYENFKIQN